MSITGNFGTWYTVTTMDERQLLNILADGCFHSGQKLANHLGISRAAVWKRLQLLQSSLGVELYAVSGKGYKLVRPLQLLESDKLSAALRQNLDQPICPQVDVQLSLESTNQLALETARQFPQQSRLILAERQTAGRGRRGRQWLSPFGRNLYLSLYWWYDAMPEALGSLSLFVAVKLALCLEANGVPQCELKWPNDVRYQGKKLAGILLEMQGEAGGGCGIVIGMGINLDMQDVATESIGQPWTDVVSVTGKTIDRHAFTVQLVLSLIEGIRQLSQSSFNACLADWQQRDVLYGKPVRLESPNEMVEGIAKGIDATGALLLERNGQMQRYLSGEVSVRLAD